MTTPPFQVQDPHGLGFSAWVEAVYKAMAEVRSKEARAPRAIQVSRQWYIDHRHPQRVWGVPIEVDERLFGDGFRVVA